MGPCTVPSAQTCPTPTPAPWRNRRTPRRRSDILSAPPMLAWPCKRQKTIDRLWSWGPKMTPPDRRCHGFSMVPGTILNPYTHIGDLPVLVPCAHALRQPRGFHLSWFESLYRFARRRPQLTRDPAARRQQRIRVCIPLCCWLFATEHVRAHSRLDT
jgi:hypothetical protein